MKVTVINPEYQRQAVWQFVQEPVHYYEGEEVKVKHVGHHELALTTGQEDWPIRVIQRRLITTIDGQPYLYQEHGQTHKVKGSKGEIYTVTLGARPTCTCTGFQFRKSCKHTVAL